MAWPTGGCLCVCNSVCVCTHGHAYRCVCVNVCVFWHTLCVCVCVCVQKKKKMETKTHLLINTSFTRAWWSMRELTQQSASHEIRTVNNLQHGDKILDFLCVKSDLKVPPFSTIQNQTQNYHGGRNILFLHCSLASSMLLKTILQNWARAENMNPIKQWPIQCAKWAAAHSQSSQHLTSSHIITFDIFTQAVMIIPFDNFTQPVTNFDKCTRPITLLLDHKGSQWVLWLDENETHKWVLHKNYIQSYLILNT